VFELTNIFNKFDKSINFTFHPFKVVLAKNYLWALGSHSYKYGIIVRCSNDNITGYGEIAFPPNINRHPENDLIELSSNIKLLNSPKFDQINPRFRHGIISSYTAFLAEKNKIPLYQLLSNNKNGLNIKVPINGLIASSDTKILINKCEEFIEQGITTIKVKCSDRHQQNIKIIKKVIELIPDATLRLDPNASWDKISTKDINLYTKFNIEYIEEPFGFSNNVNFLREKLLKLPFNIALDHWGSDFRELQNIIDLPKITTVIIKPQLAGGTDKVLQLVEYIKKEGLNVVITASLETLIGITHCLHIIGTLNLPINPSGLHLWDFISPNVTHFPKIKNGFWELGTEPGIGFCPDLNMLTMI
jgi:L-alanine-DL-glutamate epimerase-like enolase superfamily enzyme